MAKQIGDTSSADLCYTPARELARRIREREMSCRELMTAYLARIEDCNPRVNAICTQIPEEQALALAEEADQRLVRDDGLGPLHGLPIGIKDLSATRGIRTTMGSPIFADNIPEQDSLLVQRVKRAGMLVVGKTNTPEFGTGSHTFNSLFGTTRNPHNLDKSAGGSSGGAAAALASGMLPLADGSDMGGSLRNPASFCGVVGLRPSLGRVPHWPSTMAWQCRLGVEGPMARDVEDCALFLSVLAGPDERDPLSIQEPGTAFTQGLQTDFRGSRVAWAGDLGQTVVAREVKEICEASLGAWETAGFRVEHAHPDMVGAMESFKVLRAAYYAEFGAPLLSQHRELMKDTVIENIEAGMSLTGRAITRADATRTRLYTGLLKFFEDYDFMLLPAAQVLPFDVETEWVDDIDGQSLASYLDWMSICCIITLFGLPAISLPCGYSASGLPVGLQIVGRPRADLEVLRAAWALEQVIGPGRRPPAFRV